MGSEFSEAVYAAVSRVNEEATVCGVIGQGDSYQSIHDTQMARNAGLADAIRVRLTVRATENELQAALAAVADLRASREEELT